jgi:uncharacterized cupin superfamily protein
MIDLQTFADLAAQPLGAFAPKPTSLTEGQSEANAKLWTSPDGRTSIGVWECTPGRFTADRSKAAEYCHIISGSATVSNQDGSVVRRIGPGAEEVELAHLCVDHPFTRPAQRQDQQIAGPDA